MREGLQAQMRRIAVYVRYFLKWSALALLAGAVCGAVGAVFHHAVELAGGLFAAHGWLLFFLPVAGLAITLSYQLAGIEQDRGANLVLVSLRTGKPMPPAAALRIFAGTFLTHLCGGSAGREGAALLIGAGVASCFEKVFVLKEDDAKRMTMCGMSGLFSAVFGTPVTAALFSMEVSSVGVMHYGAIYPCLTSSLSAWAVSRLLGTHGVVMPSVILPEGDVYGLLRVVLLALICALCSILFLTVMHLVGRLCNRFLSNPYLKTVAGGCLVILVTWLLGTRIYNGAGMDVVAAAVAGRAVPWAFLAKILLTALTIGAGFKGGEIVPAFFVGATLGCTVGPLLGLEPGFAAAIGLVALFCGMVNCPVASIVLAVELFGGAGISFFALACGVSYLMSGYYSLYAEQRILYSKLDGRENEGK